jgi:predicted SprT family Zn-dependent metalloprotease
MAAPENSTTAQRYYTCQSCQKHSTEPQLFKLVKIDRIGFVICTACLED